MTVQPVSHISRNRRGRRILALFVFGWLNLVVQPCLAQMPGMAAGLEHCDHGGSPSHRLPCPEMRADDCVTANELGVDGPHAAGPARIAALLALLPPDMAAEAGMRPGVIPGTHHATGPSLNIRFCMLRN